jgi:hypothetical protein
MAGLNVGALPTDANGRTSGSGYSPGVGTMPIQLGSASADGANGASGQQSAPVVMQHIGVGGTNVAGIDVANHQLFTSGGKSTTAVAAGTSANTVIKATAGRLGRVLISTLGTNQLVIFDNATTNSGTIIGVVAASAVAGTVADFQMPAAAGITVQGNASNPAFTISWS